MSGGQAVSDELLLRVVSDPDAIANPYPLLNELRDTAPVHKLGFADFWVLTRFEDCRAVLRDLRLGSAEPGTDAPTLSGRTSRTSSEPRSMLFMNPPDHTRLRKLVSRAFTPRRVAGLRQSVEAMTAELLDELDASGGGDLIDALAFPLPANVISELVGVPRADRDWLRPLVADLTATLEPSASAEDLAKAADSGGEVRAYIHELIEHRRARPADDMLSALIAASDGEDRLTQSEVAVTVLLIYAAGFETTSNLIGNIVNTLLRHTGQLAMLRANRALVPTAVEEVLRFEPPVHVDGRFAFDDVEVGGHVIPAGHSVLTLLGAANRDPAVIDRPDTFDVTRDTVPLLSFSSGIHYCLGASLARLEGQVVLEGLLDRFAVWERLEDDPPWKRRITLRGLERLPVALS